MEYTAFTDYIWAIMVWKEICLIGKCDWLTKISGEGNACWCCHWSVSGYSHCKWTTHYCHYLAFFFLTNIFYATLPIAGVAQQRESHQRDGPWYPAAEGDIQVDTDVFGAMPADLAAPAARPASAPQQPHLSAPSWPAWWQHWVARPTWRPHASVAGRCPSVLFMCADKPHGHLCFLCVSLVASGKSSLLLSWFVYVCW